MSHKPKLKLVPAPTVPNGAGRGRGYHRPEGKNEKNGTASLARDIRDLNGNLQFMAEKQGVILNRMMKHFDPRAEDIITGHSHRAAGLLVHDGKSVLMVKFAKGLEIPGGKAQGSEYPLETATREAGEETLRTLTKEMLDSLYQRPIPSYVVAAGKYTIFLVDATELKLGNIVEDFKDKLAAHKDDAEEPPSALVWWTPGKDKLEDLAPFAKEILNTPAIATYLNKAATQRESTADFVKAHQKFHAILARSVEAIESVQPATHAAQI